MTQFADNPDYREVYHNEHTGTRLYAPVQAGAYHTSRMVAVQAQDLYASVGTSKEVLYGIVKQTLDLCNSDADNGRLRTDVGVLMNNLLYRMQYPVDEQCGLRMGALLCLAEGEDPNTVSDAWTQKKLRLAAEDPDLYTFFLHTGLRSTSSYTELLDTITDTQMQTRAETLRSLILQEPSPTK
ncbi:MAG: hypothetical protein EOP52_13540 [Sphingobacteriales bacterium]|nr:MAG: hypothetical protein EOP52_13540 [Sphingobacteriales bacterium]